MLEQLESTRRELDKGGLGMGGEVYTRLNELIVVESQLRVANNELENSSVSELWTEKEAVRLEAEAKVAVL